MRCRYLKIWSAIISNPVFHPKTMRNRNNCKVGRFKRLQALIADPVVKDFKLVTDPNVTRIVNT